MTPAETRERLRDLHARAKAAGLRAVVGSVDIALALASARAIEMLEAALADPGLQTQHQAIVESLDADPTPARTPIAPPRKPAPLPGANGGSAFVPPNAKLARLPSLRTPPPKAPRRITGPDEDDLKIPF
jgi:hypothetical protein